MRWIIVVTALSIAQPGVTAVLCQKKSGAVFIRSSCKKKESPVDLSQFGAVGPKGDPGPPGIGPLTTCPADSVRVGPACIDKYKASVWLVAPSNTDLIAKLQDGTVTLGDLTGAGAVQLGCADAYFHHTAAPVYFPASGQWTPVLGSNPPSPGVYVASLPGVLPSACISWFQAQEACALSGKRLLTNEEWQRAAAGTPDPGDADDGATTCVTKSPAPASNGSRSKCVSQWGAFDMTGNLDEWVAEWWPQPTFSSTWKDAFSDDFMGLGGANMDPGSPGVLWRGGGWGAGTLAGVFAVQASIYPYAATQIGFRCAR
ncbi:MAG TPA: SUMF1/EgtB/PvdO family nonheme iron enzyme [Candidatus Eisenbacteria bacterium]|nr:SUMF1/EgtB/PvdO family nonheme iron enzyme [Candidatus Eisenbacteria bacterium]